MYRATISALLIVLLASTGALGAPAITGNPVQIQEVRAPEGAGGVEHDCCHPTARFNLELVPPQAPSEMPCGGHHSCCMSSAPEYPVNVPSPLNWERPGVAHNCSVPETALPSLDFCASRGTSTAHLLPYSRLSTILRI